MSTNQTLSNIEDNVESQVNLEIVIPQQMAAPSNQDNPRKRRLEVYEAAIKGDWDKANSIYEKNPGEIRCIISKQNETALHIAAAAKNAHFVEQMVHKMSERDLAMRSHLKNTAFCYVAATGNVRLAQVMMNKNKELPMIRGGGRMLPIHIAASLGHEKMVQHLYDATKQQLERRDLTILLINLIETDLYEVAWDVLKDHRELAIARDNNREILLHALARKPVSKRRPMHPKAVELVKLSWEQLRLLPSRKISKLIREPTNLIFTAVEQGNVQFITTCINLYPDLIWIEDEKHRSMFHVAVLYRHEDIFKLIHDIGSIKDLIATYEDKWDNNMLHLAGLVAPSHRLNVVAGAALQLQYEFSWFQAVKEVLQPIYAQKKNKNGETPLALFMKKHKRLVEEGEKWMRDTASSCMVVATLVATVVFAAAFTVPGGLKQDVGNPVYLQRRSFKIFALSDACSLFCSVVSISAFLSMLTSRYAVDDFKIRLPLKLVTGLFTLFLSLIAMMVTFTATFFMIFSDDQPVVPIILSGVASLPTLSFIVLQCPLLLKVLNLMFKSRSLRRPTNKLFRRG